MLCPKWAKYVSNRYRKDVFEQLEFQETRFLQNQSGEKHMYQTRIRSLGRLWKNQLRRKEKSPALTGNINIQPDLMKQLLQQYQQNPSEPVQAKLAAWKNHESLTIEIQAKHETTRKSIDADDEDLLTFLEV